MHAFNRKKKSIKYVYFDLDSKTVDTLFYSIGCRKTENQFVANPEPYSLFDPDPSFLRGTYHLNPYLSTIFNSGSGSDSFSNVNNPGQATDFLNV